MNQISCQMQGNSIAQGLRAYGRMLLWCPGTHIASVQQVRYKHMSTLGTCECKECSSVAHRRGKHVTCCAMS